MLGQMTWNHAGWHNLVIIPNPSCGVLGGIICGIGIIPCTVTFCGSFPHSPPTSHRLPNAPPRAQYGSPRRNSSSETEHLIRILVMNPRCVPPIPPEDSLRGRGCTQARPQCFPRTAENLS